MNKNNLRALLMPGIIGAVFVFVFIGIVGAALHNPKPQNLPIAIVGPTQATAQMQALIKQKSKGAVEPRAYSSKQEAIEDLKAHKLFGVITPSPKGVDVTVSSASGEAAKQIVSQLGTALSNASNTTANITDITPDASGPGRSMIMMFLLLATTIGAIIGQSFIRSHGSASFAVWAASTTITSVLTGLSGAIVAATLGEFKDAFWGVAGVISLASMTMGLVVAAAQAAFGKPGLGIAALLLLPLGIATSGAVVGNYFLPNFYAWLAPILPAQAVIDTLRQVAYVDAVAIGEPLRTLLLWAAGSIVIVGTAAYIKKPDAAKKSATQKA